MTAYLFGRPFFSPLEYLAGKASLISSVSGQHRKRQAIDIKSYSVTRKFSFQADINEMITDSSSDDDFKHAESIKCIPVFDHVVLLCRCSQSVGISAPHVPPSPQVYSWANFC